MAVNDFADGAGGLFVGRQRELTALLRSMAGAARGRGGFVLVTGQAGMGKSTLVVEAAGYAADAGAGLSWGHGRPEPGPPLSAWREALLGLGAGPLASLAAEERSTAVDLFQLVAGEVERLASDRPLVVVLEDLHWADDLSLRQLAWLRPRLSHLAVLVLGTSRTPIPAAGRPDLHLELDGLTASEVGVLASAHSGADIDAELLHRRTGGNPLFVVEAARHGSGSVPESIREVVRHRLEALDAEVREVVAAAAVLGDNIDAATLAAVVGIDDTRLLDAAIHHRFLLGDETGRRLRFQHDVVREAVDGTIEPSRRRRLHLLAARALAAGGAEPAAVASHLLRAGPEADVDEVVAEAERAGREAVRLFAHEDAARWFGQARNLLGPGDPRGLDLQLAAADALGRAGDVAGAWSSYEEVAALAEAMGHTRALALAALGFGGGRAGFEVPPSHEGQRRWLQRALERLDDGDDVLRSLLLSRLSITLAFEGDPARQKELANAAVEAARRSGDAAATVTALSSWCDAHAAPDHVQDRLRVAEEMVGLAASAGDLELELLGLRFRIVTLLEVGDRATVERVMARFAALAERLRQPRISFYVPLFAATLSLADGRLEDAEQFNREAAAIGRQGSSENAEMLTISQLCLIRIVEGRIAELEAPARKVIRERPEVTGPRAGLALVEARLGRVESARALIDLLRTDRFGLFPFDAEWLSAMAIIAEAIVVSDHEQAARQLLPLLVPYRGLFAVDGIGCAIVAPVALTAAELAAVIGDLEQADALFAQALDDCRRLGARLLLARAAGAWAVSLAGRDADRACQLRAIADGIRQDVGLADLEPAPAPAAAAAVRPAPGSAPGRRRAALRREGDVWALAWGGSEVRIRHSNGLVYLRELVGRPHQEIHVLDLAAPVRRGVGAGVGVDGDLGPMLDAKARQAYRQRVADLREEIDEAAAGNDFVRSEKLEAELDQLVHQLAAATGLGGRARPAGSAAERARVNVTKSIKSTLDRLEAQLPALAHHLRTTVRTGTFCAYIPDPLDPPEWDLARTPT